MSDDNEVSIRDRISRNLASLGIELEEPDPIGPDHEAVIALVEKRKELGIRLDVMAKWLKCSVSVVEQIESGAERMTWAHEQVYRDIYVYGMPVFRYSSERLDEIYRLYSKNETDLTRSDLAVRLSMNIYSTFHSTRSDPNLAESFYRELMAAIETIARLTYGHIDEVIDLGEGLFELDKLGVAAKRLRPDLDAMARIAVRRIALCQEEKVISDEYKRMQPTVYNASKPLELKFTDTLADIWSDHVKQKKIRPGMGKYYRAFFDAAAKPVYTFEPYRENFGLGWSNKKFDYWAQERLKRDRSAADEGRC